MSLKIAITSDHGGYALKQDFIENYNAHDVQWMDLGADSTESVDYPDFAHKLAQVITNGEADFGVAICGTGIGISMALNRHDAVRASVCTNTTMAKLTRVDNNANVLCLGARIVGNLLAFDCLSTFLETKFEAGGRHERRVNKINPQ